MDDSIGVPQCPILWEQGRERIGLDVRRRFERNTTSYRVMTSGRLSMYIVHIVYFLIGGRGFPTTPGWNSYRLRRLVALSSSYHILIIELSFHSYGYSYFNS